MLSKCLVLMLVIGYVTHIHVTKPEPGVIKVEAAVIELEASSEVEVPKTPQDFVKLEAAKYGWHEGAEWQALSTLIHNESSWRPGAVNPSSGACGLFQAWPCSKLGVPLEDLSGQSKWGLNYISKRYGSPSKALDFWLRQKPHHWY